MIERYCGGAIDAKIVVAGDMRFNCVNARMAVWRDNAAGRKHKHLNLKLPRAINHDTGQVPGPGQPRLRRHRARWAVRAIPFVESRELVAGGWRDKKRRRSGA